MNSIIIVGAAGRMGQTLIRLAQEQGLTITALVERAGINVVSLPQVITTTNLETVLPQPSSVVIDFTAPENSLNIARLCAKHKQPLIIGTTGLNAAQEAELVYLSQATQILYSPNMSIGINALLKVLPNLTQMLGPNYDLEVLEIHHNQKKDSPSGTALRLGKCIAAARDWNLDEVANYHREGFGMRDKKEIGIQTLRGGDVVGFHTVYFFGPGERIAVTHEAHSRENFAAGALRAVHWLPNQAAGLYNIGDLLASAGVMDANLAAPTLEFNPAKVWNTLVTGLQEHLHAAKATEIVLGLSGGIDSAVVAALAVDALGAKNVHGLLMPSPWSSSGSIADAQALANNLKIDTQTIFIEPLMQVYAKTLAFPENEQGLAEENIQARIRGNLLMAYANKYNWLVLSTGNKSELMVGYCTLYGDMAGSLAPLGDMYKTQVYELARWYNQQNPRIPKATIEKAPSAELRPNQTDQDSLPSYEILDQILQNLDHQTKLAGQGLEFKQGKLQVAEIKGIDPKIQADIANLVQKNSFKRLQAAPVIKL